MSILLTVTSQGSGPVMPLQLDIPGYRLEVSDIGQGRKLAVSEDSGRITVSIVAVGDVHPVAEEAKPEEAQPEAPAVQQAPSTETVREAAPETAPVARQEFGVSPSPDSQPASEQEQIFQKLVALRKQIAAEVKLPPYIIFHDVTLKEMSRLLPTDLEALKGIQGVGLAKLEKYGRRFLEAIRYYKAAGKAA